MIKVILKYRFILSLFNISLLTATKSHKYLVLFNLLIIYMLIVYGSKWFHETSYWKYKSPLTSHFLLPRVITFSSFNSSFWYLPPRISITCLQRYFFVSLQFGALSTELPPPEISTSLPSTPTSPMWLSSHRDTLPSLHLSTYTFVRSAFRIWCIY